MNDESAGAVEENSTSFDEAHERRRELGIEIVRRALDDLRSRHLLDHGLRVPRGVQPKQPITPSPWLGQPNHA
jgi:hypothetical protein